MKILVTCPPMLGMINELNPFFEKNNFKITAPNVIQTLSVEELCKIVPQHHGWIIGDDPATREVFEAGKKGNLIAAVKWGIGTDNVDFVACKDLNIPITNTPGMFGPEVADIAVGYLIGLARETFQIHVGVKNGLWPKPRGMSIFGSKVAIIGLGDIGFNVVKRLSSFGMKIIGYDPKIDNSKFMNFGIDHQVWPNKIQEADFIIITCDLNDSTRFMINKSIFNLVKKGVRIINVSRGAIIKEGDLIEALKNDVVYSCALDVFETEPLPNDSFLRDHPRSIFGSHNASNTKDAVVKTSIEAINKLKDFVK